MQRMPIGFQRRLVLGVVLLSFRETLMAYAQRSDAAGSDFASPVAMDGIARLARLAAQGTVARTVGAAASAMVRSWKGEGIRLFELRARIEALQFDVESGLVAAEDFVADAETDAQRRAAQAQYDGLKAINTVIAEELEEMRLTI